MCSVCKNDNIHVCVCMYEYDRVCVHVKELFRLHTLEEDMEGGLLDEGIFCT